VKCVVLSSGRLLIEIDMVFVKGCCENWLTHLLVILHVVHAFDQFLNFLFMLLYVLDCASFIAKVV